MTDSVTQIIENPFCFGELVNKTDELALLAVSINPHALQYIPIKYQKYNICKAALQKDPRVLVHILAPRLVYYKIAVKSSIYSPLLGEIIDMIPEWYLRVFQVFPKVLLRVVNISTVVYLGKFLRKLPLILWNNTIIYDLLCGISFKNEEVLVEFLRERNVPFSKRVNKLLLKSSSASRNSLVGMDEKMVKYCLKHNIGLSKDIKTKWARGVTFTLNDFQKMFDKRTALELCKNITHEMLILYSSTTTPWTVINVFLQMGLLTGSLLVDVIKVARKKLNCSGNTKFDGNKFVPIKLNTLEQVIRRGNLENLNKMDLTTEHLKEIQAHSIIIYDYLRAFNVNVHNYVRVIIRDKATNKNYEMCNWNVSLELANLKKDHGVVTMVFNNNIYKFKAVGETIRAVMILD